MINGTRKLTRPDEPWHYLTAPTTRNHNKMARDPNKLREYGKVYRERNRDRERDRKAEWYAKNREDIRARRKLKRAGVTPDE